jgi:hypothetical protein
LERSCPGKLPDLTGCYASEQLILQRITENRRQKSKRKNKSLCSHGQGPGKRTEERKQGNGGLGSDDPKSTAHYKLQNKFFIEMKTRFIRSPSSLPYLIIEIKIKFLTHFYSRKYKIKLRSDK